MRRDLIDYLEAEVSIQGEVHRVRRLKVSHDAGFIRLCARGTKERAPKTTPLFSRLHAEHINVNVLDYRMKPTDSMLKVQPPARENKRRQAGR